MTTTIIPGRIAADLDADEHVLFHIGMRINRLRAVRDWWPPFMAFPRMVAELRGQPDLGLLDATSYRAGRTIVSIQHWRSVDHLHDYARGRTGAHLPAWQAFNRRSRGNGAVGLFHETYLVAPGSYETLYVGMPVVGLAAATRAVDADRLGRSARRRLTREGPDVPGQPAPPYAS